MSATKLLICIFCLPLSVIKVEFKKKKWICPGNQSIYSNACKYWLTFVYLSRCYFMLCHQSYTFLASNLLFSFFHTGTPLIAHKGKSISVWKQSSHTAPASGPAVMSRDAQRLAHLPVGLFNVCHDVDADPWSLPQFNSQNALHLAHFCFPDCPNESGNESHYSICIGLNIWSTE